MRERPWAGRARAAGEEGSGAVAASSGAGRRRVRRCDAPTTRLGRRGCVVGSRRLVWPLHPSAATSSTHASPPMSHHPLSHTRRGASLCAAANHGAASSLHGLPGHRGASQVTMLYRQANYDEGCLISDAILYTQYMPSCCARDNERSHANRQRPQHARLSTPPHRRPRRPGDPPSQCSLCEPRPWRQAPGPCAARRPPTRQEMPCGQPCRTSAQPRGTHAWSAALPADAAPESPSDTL